MDWSGCFGCLFPVLLVFWYHVELDHLAKSFGFGLNSYFFLSLQSICCFYSKQLCVYVVFLQENRVYVVCLC